MQEVFTHRDVQTVEFQIDNDEWDFYDALTRFVDDQSIKAQADDSAVGRALSFTMAMLQRRFASSVYAVRRSLERMRSTARRSSTIPRDTARRWSMPDGPSPGLGRLIPRIPADFEHKAQRRWPPRSTWFVGHARNRAVCCEQATLETGETFSPSCRNAYMSGCPDCAKRRWLGQMRSSRASVQARNIFPVRGASRKQVGNRCY